MSNPFADLTAAQRQQIRDAHATAKERQEPELTLDVVRQVVERVLAQDRDGDPDSAHVDQDALYVWVLRAVADGHPDGRALAQECLRIADSEPTRWYA